MYGREQGDRVYTFEASGGLLNAGLVMRDRETDSWWSILNEEAIEGPAAGQRLQQIPGSVKTTWGGWKRRHPNTRVLSVEGQEHRPETPYDDYFASEDGFCHLSARDQRLRDKEHLYAFHWQGKSYTVPHSAFRDEGGVVRLDDRDLFLYRRADDSFYQSTVALIGAAGAGFAHGDEGWLLTRGEEARFWSPDQRAFTGGELAGEPLAETFTGFDTFWYIWSLTNPDSEILRPATEDGK